MSLEKGQVDNMPTIFLLYASLFKSLLCFLFDRDGCAKMNEEKKKDNYRITTYHKIKQKIINQTGKIIYNILVACILYMLLLY